MAAGSNSQAISYPAGTLGTLMELYQQAVDDFVVYLRARSPAEISASAEFSGQTIRITGILKHVAHAGFEYANDARRGLGKPLLAASAPSDLIADIVSIIPQMAEALEGVWHLTDPEIGKILIDEPWDVRYTLEQIIEHAIVHIPWHKRQCRRVLERAGFACQ